jgi:transcriptional regulator with XRE-family HTH domain
VKKRMDANELVLRIQEIMSDRGWTQKQFAEYHGISEAYLSDILRGKRDPGATLLRKMGLRRVVLYELVDQ